MCPFTTISRNKSQNNGGSPMDTINTILEKLGIYDLFVNLITGIFITATFQYLATNIYCLQNYFSPLPQLDFGSFTAVVSLILCYFIGIVFQETSNFLELALYRVTRKPGTGHSVRTFLYWFIPSIDRLLMKTNHDQPSQNLLKCNIQKKPKRDLSDWEIDQLQRSIPKYMKSNTDNFNEVLYHFCREKAHKKGKGTRLAGDQSHASMARSLALYSLLVFFATLISLVCGILKLRPSFSLLSLSAFLFFLFLRRNKRFSEMRYVNTLRACIEFLE